MPPRRLTTINPRAARPLVARSSWFSSDATVIGHDDGRGEAAVDQAEDDHGEEDRRVGDGAWNGPVETRRRGRRRCKAARIGKDRMGEPGQDDAAQGPLEQG